MWDSNEAFPFGVDGRPPAYADETPAPLGSGWADVAGSLLATAAGLAVLIGLAAFAG